MFDPVIGEYVMPAAVICCAYYLIYIIFIDIIITVLLLFLCLKFFIHAARCILLQFNLVVNNYKY